MPGSSARRTRRTIAVWVACSALLSAACSSGGGSGDSAVIPDSTASAQSSTATSVTLAWSGAAGPVAGYSVYVQRDGMGAYDHEQDVASPQVELMGEPGSTARVVVAAFDSGRRHGPGSLPSPSFTFPGQEPGT